jgi:triacylglycerol lipase
MRTRWHGRLGAVGAVLLGIVTLVGCNSGAPTTATTSLSTSATAPSTRSSAPNASRTAPSTSGTAPSPPVAAGAVPTGLSSVGLAGVNDPACRSAHRPVVLLHGTFSTARSDFAAVAPALQASGRCGYAIDYGSGGLGSVRASAQAVTGFVDQVRAATGAEQVDVIAYSQGGLVLRTALRLDGLAPAVAVAVLIAPSFHGSTSPLLDAIPADACAACADQAAGSTLLTELAVGGDLDGTVRYAVVSSTDDTIVTPTTSQVPQGPPDRVASLVIQDRCPGERVDHLSIRADPGVVGWVASALETGGSPDPATLTCH